MSATMSACNIDCMWYHVDLLTHESIDMKRIGHHLLSLVGYRIELNEADAQYKRLGTSNHELTTTPSFDP